MYMYVLEVLPEVANFSLKNDCFGRVVLCCFAFCCVVVVALPFSASLEAIVHTGRMFIALWRVGANQIVVVV